MKKLLTGLMAFVSFAATAASFSYQGVLKTAEGANVATKTQTITFRLYAEPTGGTALWGRSINVLLDKDGLFNVELSDAAGSDVEGLTNKLDQVLSQYGNSTLYIGLFVEGSAGEIRPRQKVLAVPTASFAQDVKTARNGFSIAGDAKIIGSLEIENDATLRGVEVNGTMTVNRLKVSGRTTLNGDTTIASLSVLKDANIQGQLKVGDSVVFPTIPKGVIVAWSGSGSDIPDGWALCDGNGGRPNLIDRFIRGGRGSSRPEAGEIETAEGSGASIFYYVLCYIIKL